MSPVGFSAGKGNRISGLRGPAFFSIWNVRMPKVPGPETGTVDGTLIEAEPWRRATKEGPIRRNTVSVQNGKSQECDTHQSKTDPPAVLKKAVKTGISIAATRATTNVSSLTQVPRWTRHLRAALSEEPFLRAWPCPLRKSRICEPSETARVDLAILNGIKNTAHIR